MQVGKKRRKTKHGPSEWKRETPSLYKKARLSLIWRKKKEERMTNSLAGKRGGKGFEPKKNSGRELDKEKKKRKGAKQSGQPKKGRGGLSLTGKKKGRKKRRSSNQEGRGTGPSSEGKRKGEPNGKDPENEEARAACRRAVARSDKGRKVGVRIGNGGHGKEKRKGNYRGGDRSRQRKRDKRTPGLGEGGIHSHRLKVYFRKRREKNTKGTGVL